jgi:hypothetical protein
MSLHAQEQRRALVATLLLQPGVGDGYSAIVIRRPDARGGRSIIAMRRSEFSPQLLALTIMSLEKSFGAGTAQAGPDERTYFPLGGRVPSLDGSWSSAIEKISARLVGAPHRKAQGVGDVQSITVALPSSPHCALCPKSSPGGSP